LAMEWYSTHQQHCSRATRTWRNYRGLAGSCKVFFFFFFNNLGFLSLKIENLKFWPSL
jgi:hypothetical protein